MQKTVGSSLRVTSSGGNFYEVTSPKTSKGEALIRLLDEVRILRRNHRTWQKYPDLERETTMAIGDNFNDVEMLQVAGLAVAVANSPDAVKRVADLVCSLPAGQGAVEALKLMLEVRRYRSVGV
jgi:hydroxymethylpyrimidine pyrophosphatase-like HAD family hydrolase